MRQHFEHLADTLSGKIVDDEVFLARFSGEDSDFVRLNRSKVRQPGRVEDRGMVIELIRGARHASGSVGLSGDASEDESRLLRLLERLRTILADLPEDPHLLYATEPRDTVEVRENELPPAEEMLTDVLAAGEGRDLVGILSAGGIHRGFASSLGQRNWFSTHSFHLDWSFYLDGDKAVKSAYAGFRWAPEAFRAKVETAAAQLEAMDRPVKKVSPGSYRVFLAPAALNDFLGMLGHGGFGLKAHRTKQSPLLKLAEERATLSPLLTISENTAEGVAPNFQNEGFLRPERVELVEKGRFANHLVSPRSAKEFDVAENGANGMESPLSLDVAAGELPAEEVFARLGTGIYAGNLHYLNYSDMPAGRITGMTRFACFWVEDGELVAPLSVMRFDETVYRALGENLIALTKERELLLDGNTYGGRSTSSSRMPGALIEDFRFNL